MSVETTEATHPAGPAEPAAVRQSLSTAAARTLATTTKTPPQMQGITARWLVKMLPWVQISGGTYRVNRKVSYDDGDDRIGFVKTGSQVRVIPQGLRGLGVLRDYPDGALLDELAGLFDQVEYETGAVIARAGTPVDRIFLIAHGRVQRLGVGQYGELTVLGTLSDGDHFGHHPAPDSLWKETTRAAVPCVLMTLTRERFNQVMSRTPALAEHFQRYLEAERRGALEIALSAGHHGEARLPGTYVDYEIDPREYELSVAQTVLRIHSRVADLYNQPMNQTEQQLRLTIEALRERQEDELINNRDFGLLHNTDYDQRIHPYSGAPTPDDMDELLCRRRGSQFFLAHPRTIAAFGRECSRRGLYPDPVEVQGQKIQSWRGVPIFPCSKIPISKEQTSSVLVLRTGEENEGVVGLHQTGLPDEYLPGMNVRFMGINDQAVISYLVSAYYSAAILVPDAVGILENVNVSHVADS
ncbi:Crp/Fnr family transcriptional regulator [Kitasatospora sp. MMS16-BH015]|uniref:family 2B encapsulin nanocompartment shell protein n=1 Tax=Kitasatospora sp. MMS16-BH015 TaxID=2018025 RepID=UPI000CA3BEC3|nr:family 2B encapsulin nanocompartment shell protein [Kitasatospora sp. MMS16-BH015]AUG75630.1 Crp/Fnr family transcriptional regulator [Kitasatospora sp. MMS16-BH015]